jgi:hypothetical protein
MAALAKRLDRVSAGQKYPPLRNLKVGDHVRLVHFPPEYLPRHTLHADTRRLYKYLLARRRPVKVYLIDEMGLPWIECRLRHKDGRMEWHGLLIGTETGWTKVKGRQPKRISNRRQRR